MYYTRSTSYTRCSHIWKSHTFKSISYGLNHNAIHGQYDTCLLGFDSFIAPEKNPGKRPTNLFVYHVPACLVLHALHAICAIYRKHSSSTRWLAHFGKLYTNQWLKPSTIHVCTQNQFNQPHNRCLWQSNQPHNRRLSKFPHENTCMILPVLDFPSI